MLTKHKHQKNSQNFQNFQIWLNFKEFLIRKILLAILFLIYAMCKLGILNIAQGDELGSTKI